jgi:hypothetical protein
MEVVTKISEIRFFRTPAQAVFGPGQQPVNIFLMFKDQQDSGKQRNKEKGTGSVEEKNQKGKHYGSRDRG